jgi:RNA ligase
MNYSSLQQMQQLVADKLAIQKLYGDDLVMFKYSRKAMFEYKWFERPELMECRGHVYRLSTGERVVHAPRKCFNYLENDWWKYVPLNTEVRIDKKFNGYMACATKVDDNWLITTTGSFDSEYAKYAEQMILNHPALESQHDVGCTLVFEICDNKFDPHIVEEQDGAHFLGYRTYDGNWFPATTDKTVIFITLAEAIQFAERDRGEGYMVYQLSGDPFFSRPCKMKSPYYVGKKMLMRATPYFKKDRLPYMWHDVERIITNNYMWSDWCELPEQERRKFLENYYG